MFRLYKTSSVCQGAVPAQVATVEPEEKKLYVLNVSLLASVNQTLPSLIAHLLLACRALAACFTMAVNAGYDGPFGTEP